MFKEIKIVIQDQTSLKENEEMARRLSRSVFGQVWLIKKSTKKEKKSVVVKMFVRERKGRGKE